MKDLYTYINESIFDVEDNIEKVEKIILNILSNAIKYTPEKGTINVISGQQKDFAYIKITDTGMGIPQKDLPKLFDRFYRVDKARSRQMGGTGLGLSIVKETLEKRRIRFVYSKYGNSRKVL